MPLSDFFHPSRAPTTPTFPSPTSFDPCAPRTGLASYSIWINGLSKVQTSQTSGLGLRGPRLSPLRPAPLASALPSNGILASPPP